MHLKINFGYKYLLNNGLKSVVQNRSRNRQNLDGWNLELILILLIAGYCSLDWLLSQPSLIQAFQMFCLKETNKKGDLSEKPALHQRRLTSTSLLSLYAQTFFFFFFFPPESFTVQVLRPEGKVFNRTWNTCWDLAEQHLSSSSRYQQAPQGPSRNLIGRSGNCSGAQSTRETSTAGEKKACSWMFEE